MWILATSGDGGVGAASALLADVPVVSLVSSSWATRTSPIVRLQTVRISLVGELDRNAESQAPAQSCCIRNGVVTRPQVTQ